MNTILWKKFWFVRNFGHKELKNNPDISFWFWLIRFRGDNIVFIRSYCKFNVLLSIISFKFLLLSRSFLIPQYLWYLWKVKGIKTTISLSQTLFLLKEASNFQIYSIALKKMIISLLLAKDIFLYGMISGNQKWHKILTWKVQKVHKTS